MSCNKNTIPLLALSLALLLVLAGCGLQDNTSSSAPEAPEPGEAAVEERSSGTQAESAPAASSGLYDNWEDNNPIAVTLDGSTIHVDGDGASADGGVLTITASGVYVLSGTLDDGQIIVDAGKEDTVQLVLNGADITCSTSAPIYSAKAGMTVVTLADGTSNSLTDGKAYLFPDEETDEPDAALFCKNDLTITGTGSLTVTAGYNNGIGSKDDLVIERGIISVDAANHGIRGRDSLTVLDGSIAIRSGNDGLQSNNESEGKGWILLAGGSFAIEADHDAIQAESDLTITGGAYSLSAGGGHEASPADTDGSYKGLKAGVSLTVDAGTFDIDSADDAVHANGDVTINGGTFTISTGDDGFHADDALVINDGVIDIAASYEGLEGSTVDINGGDIRLVARDDGVNAAGNDEGSEGGPFGRDPFAANENNQITITGGRLVVSASGDGLDSNGNIVMSGGTVIVHGPTSGGDAPLDFDGQFTLTGGVLVAAGSSGMAQAPGSDSTQATLQVYYSSTQAAGTPVHLAAADDSPLLTFTPEKDYQNIVISLPGLEQGQAYRLYTGGSDSGDALNGLVLSGSYSGGTLVVEAQLTDITTRISDTGEAVSGGFGGFGGFGGGRGGGMPGEGGPGGNGPPDGGNRTPPDGMPGGPGDESGGPGRPGAGAPES